MGTAWIKRGCGKHLGYGGVPGGFLLECYDCGRMPTEEITMPEKHERIRGNSAPPSTAGFGLGDPPEEPTAEEHAAGASI